MGERFLITGCGGMLGEAVYAVFSRTSPHVLATDIDLNEDWLRHLDVRDIDECARAFESFRPTVVLHLAALTDLEYCELNPEEAYLTNGLGVENVALLSERYGCTMVYISTAGIFGGEKEFFTDFDEPDPLSVYGKSKYHGERFVQQHLTRYFIFRAGWMMGGGPRKDKKFVRTIFHQIAGGATELFVVDDKLGTPTYTHNFAEAISRVLESGYCGLYNQVCGGSCSRHEVAVEFVRLLGLSDRIKVTKVSSDHFKDEYFAPRPYSEKLVNLKLTARNINYMRDWRDCLEEYSAAFIGDPREDV